MHLQRPTKATTPTTRKIHRWTSPKTAQQTTSPRRTPMVEMLHHSPLVQERRKRRYAGNTMSAMARSVAGDPIWRSNRLLRTVSVSVLQELWEKHDSCGGYFLSQLVVRNSDSSILLFFHGYFLRLV